MTAQVSHKFLELGRCSRYRNFTVVRQHPKARPVFDILHSPIDRGEHLGCRQRSRDLESDDPILLIQEVNNRQRLPSKGLP
jgi:hypothetical protein